METGMNKLESYERGEEGVTSLLAPGLTSHRLRLLQGKISAKYFMRLVMKLGTLLRSL